MRYLVESDWVIDYLHEVERTAGRLGELAPDGLGLSIVSLAELYEGLFHSQRPEADEQVLQAFLCGVDVVDLDEETCRIFARERARCAPQATSSATSTC